MKRKEKKNYPKLSSHYDEMMMMRPHPAITIASVDAAAAAKRLSLG